MNIRDVASIADGRWESTLNCLGLTIPENKKHGACPICGGSDRFRFDDKEGRGTYYCNQCGAGDGFTLTSKALNLSVRDAANVINNIVGGRKPLPIKKIALPDYEKAARKAQYILEQSFQVTEHPYLKAKGIKSHGVTVSSKGDLVIPIFSGEHVSSLQFIKPDGSKCMLGGGKIKGCFGSIGQLIPNDNLVLLCEGFATAATLNECTGYPVFYCFNANNLHLVAETLVHEYVFNPLICADNDCHLQNNVGINKARDTANKLKLMAVAPDQEGDFNDLMLAKGKQAVIETLRGYISWI
jgi:putative DNA primase/helicase